MKLITVESKDPPKRTTHLIVHNESADRGCHHAAQGGYCVREAHQNPGVIGGQIEVIYVETDVCTAANGHHEHVHTYGCICVFAHVAQDNQTQRTAAHPCKREQQMLHFPYMCIYFLSVFIVEFYLNRCQCYFTGKTIFNNVIIILQANCIQKITIIVENNKKLSRKIKYKLI